MKIAEITKVKYACNTYSLQCKKFSSLILYLKTEYSRIAVCCKKSIILPQLLFFYFVHFFRSKSTEGPEFDKYQHEEHYMSICEMKSSTQKRRAARLSQQSYHKAAYLEDWQSDGQHGLQCHGRRSTNKRTIMSAEPPSRRGLYWPEATAKQRERLRT